MSTLPLDITGISEPGTATIRFGILYEDSSPLSRSQRRLVELGAVLQGYDGGHELSTVRIGQSDDVSDRSAGDLRDRLLHLGGRNIGTRGLDHRAAPADEVHEAVVVGADEITCVEPAVGVEALLTAALVVPLHEERPADTELADCAAFDGFACVGIDDLGVESGCRPAERSASVFGLVGLVLADQ